MKAIGNAMRDSDNARMIIERERLQFEGTKLATEAAE